MNRLVIIGNGFDLAHGLPTRYGDFMFDYLKFGLNKAMDQDLHIDELFHMSSPSLGRGFELIRKAENLSDLLVNLRNTNVSLNHKSTFVKSLFQKTTNPHWVDVEQYFFQHLKDIFKQFGTHQESHALKRLNDLNLDFENLKRKLEMYLNKVSKGFNNVPSPMMEKILFGPIAGEGPNKRYPKSTMLLNFNYTATLRAYTTERTQIQLNYIHGELKNEDNPIIFGCGDTNNSTYQMIEDLDRNEFFQHVKLFRYLHTPNYQSLMDFINNDEFEVMIVGHSCGLSDRVMLKRIFEDKNCIKIKPCYYTDSTSGFCDFNDRVFNISRHFSNKVEMMNKLLAKDTKYSIH